MGVEGYRMVIMAMMILTIILKITSGGGGGGGGGGASASASAIAIRGGGGAASNGNNNIPCGSVTSTLAPCFGYVLGGGPVPLSCCNGVKALYKHAATVSQRRQVCGCLKQITRTASPAALQHAKALPALCGLTLPFQITPQIDCRSVN